MRHIIKKIAALSIGATMIGATLMGAMASDLSHSSQPVLDNGLGINAADIINSLDVSTALADAIHQEHGDIDFGKYDLSFEKSVEFAGSSGCEGPPPQCMKCEQKYQQYGVITWVYGADSSQNGKDCTDPANGVTNGFCKEGFCRNKTCEHVYGKYYTKCGEGTVLNCCPPETICCHNTSNIACCKPGPFPPYYVCDVSYSSDICRQTSGCPEGEKLCTPPYVQQGTQPKCCKNEEVCIDAGFGLWQCGKNKTTTGGCNSEEVQCGNEQNGGVFCCPKVQGCYAEKIFDNPPKYRYRCGSDNLVEGCDYDYTRCMGASYRICCKDGLEVCINQGRNPKCVLVDTTGQITGPQIIDTKAPGTISTPIKGTSIYLLRDSSDFHFSGTAFVLSPKRSFKSDAMLSFNYTLYNFSDISSINIYRYEDENSVLDFCTEKTVSDSKTFTISLNGSNISFNNEFFLDVPKGALEYDSLLEITKYSLVCPDSNQLDPLPVINPNPTQPATIFDFINEWVSGKLNLRNMLRLISFWKKL
jgi:hypothetical protein